LAVHHSRRLVAAALVTLATTGLAHASSSELAGTAGAGTGSPVFDRRSGEATAILERARDYRLRHGVLGDLTPGQMLSRATWSYERWLDRERGKEISGEGWVSLGPVNGAGRCTAVASHPSVAGTVLAGTAGGGVWRTTDGGLTWYPLTDGISDLSVGAVAYAPSDPRVIYVGSGEGGIAIDFIPGIGLLRSDDDGETWFLPAGPDQVAASQFFALSVDPEDPDSLLAATNQGLLASQDGGLTWDNRLWDPGLLGVTEVVRSARDPEILYAALWCTSLCPEGLARVMRSADRGLTWQPASGGLPDGQLSGPFLNRTAITVSTADERVLYAGLNAGENQTGGPLSAVFRTVDGGETWVDTGYEGTYLGMQGWFDNAITVHPVDPDIVVAAGIWYEVSHDGGATWTRLNPYAEGNDPMGTETMPHVDGQDLQWQGDTLWLACDGGIWSSSDFGLVWTGRNQGLVTRQYYGLALDPIHRQRMLGGTQDNATNLRRLEDDDTWDVVIGGDGFQCAINPLVSDWMYGTVYSTQILRNTHGGVGEWELISPPHGGETTPFITPLAMRPEAPWVLYTGTTRVWTSADAGESWTRLSADVTNGGWSAAVVRAIAISAAEPDLIWVAKGQMAYRSLDSGQTWFATMHDANVNSIAVSPFDPDMVLVCLAQTATGADQVRRSIDGGLTWQSGSQGLPPFAVQVARWDPTDPEVVYAGTDVGLYRSRDRGVSWEVVGDGLPAASIYDVGVLPDGSKLVVATHGRGVWELAIPQSTNAAPVVEMTSPEGDLAAILGEEVSFSAEASDADGDRVALSWIFGDRWGLEDGGSGDGAVSSSTGHRFDRGGRFLVAVHAADGHGGAAFDAIEVAAYEPADDCATPRAVPGGGPFPVTIVTENQSAGESESDPEVPCVGPDGEAGAGGWGSLWFELKPEESALYTVETCGSAADTVLSAWTGPACGPYQEVEGGCSDDDELESCSGARTDSHLELALEAGTTYRFMVGSWEDDERGAIRFTVDCDGCSGSSDTGVYMVPAAAHAGGLNQTLWVTDLFLLNPGSEVVTAHLEFLPEAEGGTAGEAEEELAPGLAVEFQDVVASLLGTAGSGAIRIVASDELVIASRTYNLAPQGTYGQGIPGALLETGTPPHGVARLIGLAGNDAFRTNIGLASADTTVTPIAIDLFDAQGTLLASQQHQLPPRSWWQLNEVFASSGLSGIEGATAEVRHLGEEGTIFAYASVVDQHTGDPTYVTAAAVAHPGSPVWIAAVAHSDGVGGTHWRSDLSLANVGTEDLFARLELIGPPGKGSEPLRHAVFVPEGRTVEIRDVVGEGAFETIGSGAIGVTVDWGNLMVTSRTYTLAGEGTYGQSIPGWSESDAITEGAVAALTQLRQSTSFRTNIGFVNLGEQEIRIAAEYRSGQGALIASRDYALPALSWQQLNSAVPEGADHAFVSSPTAGAQFLVYASVVDNASGDPVYVAARPLDR